MAAFRVTNTEPNANKTFPRFEGIVRTLHVLRVAVSAGVMGACLACTGMLAAQEDPTELAKKTQNPVSDLVSLPFQFNFNNGGDLDDGTFFNLNFQPVVPVKVSPRWSLIVRTIIPYLSFPGPPERVSGLGDIQGQLYLTPAKSGKIIWGVGPVVSFPTATNDLFATGSWAAGPGFVGLTMTGPWVIGALLNQIWTFADDGSDPEVNQLTFQPFINYNFGQGWALAFAPLWTANWNAPDGEEWTVPLGIGLSKTTVFNKRPMTLGLQYYHNVDRPDGSYDNQLRFAISLLYPTAPKPPVGGSR